MSKYKDTQQDNRDHTAVKRYQNAASERWRGNRKSCNCEKITQYRDIPEDGQCFSPGIEKPLNPVVFDLIQEFFEVQIARFMRAFIELLPHDIQRPAPGIFSVTRLKPQFSRGGPLFVHDKVDIFF